MKPILWKTSSQQLCFYAFSSDLFKSTPGAGKGNQQYKARLENPTSEKVQSH